MQDKNILLVVHHEPTGLNYHRQLIPHTFLCNEDESFKTTMTYDSIEGIVDEKLKEFQAVFFLRGIHNSKITMLRLKKLGIKIVFDIDDFWELPPIHKMPAKQKYIIEETARVIIGYADLVTTTTPYLADKIRELNKNVEIIPNAIDPYQKQFQPKTIENKRLRFGWIGGMFHYDDFKEINFNFQKLQKDDTLKNQWQFCLGGFNAITIGDLEIKHFVEKYGCEEHLLRTMNHKQLYDYLKTKKITLKDNEYIKLEKLITMNYAWFDGDDDYKQYLLDYTPLMEHYSLDKCYRRLWGRDVMSYATLYNEIDIAVIPLNDTVFNRCKSQLKIIEAGFMGKAVIASNTIPYTYDCNNKNSILCDKGDFYKAMKRCINNPELVKDLSAQLYQDVQKYHIENVNKLRKEIYNKYLV